MKNIILLSLLQTSGIIHLGDITQPTPTFVWSQSLMPTTATDEDFDSLIPSAEDPETSYFDLTSFQDGSTEADDHNLEDALRTINAFHSAFEQSDTLNYFSDSDSDLEDAEYLQQVNFHHPSCHAPDGGYLTDDDCPQYSQQAYLQNINIFGKVGEMFKKAKDAVLPAG